MITDTVLVIQVVIHKLWIIMWKKIVRLKNNAVYNDTMTFIWHYSPVSAIDWVNYMHIRWYPSVLHVLFELLAFFKNAFCPQLSSTQRWGHLNYQGPRYLRFCSRKSKTSIWILENSEKPEIEPSYIEAFQSWHCLSLLSFWWYAAHFIELTDGQVTISSLKLDKPKAYAKVKS